MSTPVERLTDCQCASAPGEWWLTAHVDITALALKETAPHVKRVAAKYAERKPGIRTRFVPEGSTIEDQVRQGFVAEWAVAEALGLNWNKGDHLRADVGWDVEVRNTRWTPPLLAVYPGDDPGRRFVLTTTSSFQVHVHGWAPGWQVRRLGDFPPTGWKAGPGGEAAVLPIERLHYFPLHPVGGR